MSLHLLTPDDFPAFPYVPPYPIQILFMRHIYQSIENRAVTLVESPTGTVIISTRFWLFRLTSFSGKDPQLAYGYLDMATR